MRTSSSNRIAFLICGASLLGFVLAGRVTGQDTPRYTTGQKAPAFQAKTTAGQAIKFPESYKGKVVLLDFWATWCGPCRAEIPNLSSVYEKYHPQGLEVLGVSLDRENAAQKLAEFTKENKMPWPQIYDGRYWKAALAVQYEVQSIPRAILVDGDTGMILADGNSVRGRGLAPAVEKALAGKKSVKKDQPPQDAKAPSAATAQGSK